MLQYKRDLFSAGLVETPCSPSDLFQRRKLCQEFQRKWSDAGRAVRAIHKLPKELSLERSSRTIHGSNLIAFRNTTLGGGSLSFVRLPPVTSQLPIEWWNISPFPPSIGAFSPHLSDNILAVAEVNGR